MQVGICDDDGKWRQKAKKVILKYAKETDTKIDVLLFEGKKELEAYKGAPLEALFLDIILGEDNGIELAVQVNKRWKNCQIVYLTDSLDYATEVYETAHIFYVLKDQFSRRIGQVFSKVFHNLEKKREALIFSVIGGKEMVLAPEEIRYFERSGRTTRVVTLWGDFQIWDKLDEIMEWLSNLDFVRCHNSYIVYLPAVREMEKGAFLLTEGIKITISRSYGKAAKAAFMRWALAQRLKKRKLLSLQAKCHVIYSKR